MRFIVSKGNKENFEELKVFESSDIRATYQFLCSKASKGRLASFEAFEREISVDLGLEPVWGFYLNDKGDECLYMKVIKDEK